MIDFKKLKENRKNHIEDLNKALKAANKTFDSDDRYWQPVRDKAGNAHAIIRFLPAVPPETLPVVKRFEYAFQDPETKLWYIENSPTTLGLPDPAYEHNNRVWKINVPLARAQKRKLYFISNIQVIEHSARPEDNGKVFLYKYGKKIYDKVDDLLNPPIESKKKINAFDLFEGANFELIIKRQDGFPNYDKSSFDRPSPIADDEQAMIAIMEQAYLLQPEIAPDKFKSYEELQKKLDRVLGKTSSTKGSGTSSKRARDEDEDDQQEVDPAATEEDDESFFKNL